MKILFVEQLTFLNLLTDIFPYWIDQRGALRKPSYFVDATKPALLCAKICAKFSDFRIERLDFKLSDIRDEQGNLIRLKMSYTDMRDVHRRVLENKTFKNILGLNPANSPRLNTFLKKQCFAGSFNNQESVWRTVFLLQVISWKSRQGHWESDEKVFFALEKQWPDEVREYAKQCGIKIVYSGRATLDLKRALIDRIGEYRLKFYYFYLSRYGLWDLIQKILFNKDPDAAIAQKDLILPSNLSKVMVNYYGHLNLKKPEFYSAFFFWQKSNIPGERLVVTFNIPWDPLDENKMAELREFRMQAVSLHPKASLIPEVPVFIHRPKADPLRLKSLLPAGQDRDVIGWAQKEIEHYQQYVSYWKDLFSRTNTKIYVTWYKLDATHCAIADALQSLGGITAVYQRSWEEFPLLHTIIDADVAFGFSTAGAERERLSQSRIPYYIATGHLGDHRFPLLKNDAQKVRQQLEENGAKRIICYLDGNSIDDSRWSTGHEMQRAGYEFLLKKLLEEPSLGLILKPKVATTLRSRLAPLGNLWEEAFKTKRCFLFEKGLLHNSYTPAIAALASDVAIHGSMCSMTAGLEAALTGTPTLLFDAEGWPYSPIYKKGIGNFVFDDWNALWKACRNYWDNPSANNKFGNWSEVINEFDQFRDGRAAERMGMFLSWVLEGYNAGLSRETILADAAERYAQMWGSDKVYSVNAAPLLIRTETGPSKILRDLDEVAP